MSHEVYLATVCLDRNRWGSRQPSFLVSDWLARFRSDGFDGVELWENHYLAADDAEQARLREAREHVALFNTYAGFADDDQQAEHRARAARAIGELQPRGVKYNIGREPSRAEQYKRNLLAWADTLPHDCRLLCECHPGTILERFDDALPFFADLDPQRFGVMAHLQGDAEPLRAALVAWRDRLQHLHLQLRTAEHETPAGRADLARCVDVLASQRYNGSASIEFTRGIGRDEQIESVYTHAVADLMAFRGAWR